MWGRPSSAQPTAIFPHGSSTLAACQLLGPREGAHEGKRRAQKTYTATDAQAFLDADLARLEGYEFVGAETRDLNGSPVLVYQVKKADSPAAPSDPAAASSDPAPDAAPKAEPAEKAKKDGKLPQTGDVASAFGLIATAGAGLVALGNKRR